MTYLLSESCSFYQSPTISGLKARALHKQKESYLNTFSVCLNKIGRTLLVHFPPKSLLKQEFRDAALAGLFYESSAI